MEMTPRRRLHLERLHASLRLAEGQAMLNAYFQSYRAGAARRGLSFTLTPNDFKRLLHGNCYYCGAPPSRVMSSPRRFGALVYNGIDRLDPSKGYDLANVVTACWQCNLRKSTMSYSEFVSWVRRIACHAKTKHTTG